MRVLIERVYGPFAVFCLLQSGDRSGRPLQTGVLVCCNASLCKPSNRLPLCEERASTNKKMRCGDPSRGAFTLGAIHNGAIHMDAWNICQRNEGRFMSCLGAETTGILIDRCCCAFFGVDNPFGVALWISHQDLLRWQSQSLARRSTKGARRPVDHVSQPPEHRFSKIAAAMAVRPVSHFGRMPRPPGRHPASGGFQCHRHGRHFAHLHALGWRRRADGSLHKRVAHYAVGRDPPRGRRLPAAQSQQGHGTPGSVREDAPGPDWPPVPIRLEGEPRSLWRVFSYGCGGARSEGRYDVHLVQSGKKGRQRTTAR